MIRHQLLSAEFRDLAEL